MILLYGLVDDPRAARRAWPPDAGRPPVVVAAGALTAIGVECDAAPEPTPDALLAHDSVVTAVMGACAVAPFRFATVIEGPAGLAPAMAGVEDRMVALLRTLRGRVEMGVRASGVPDPVSPADSCDGPGRRYLRAMGHWGRPAGLERLHRRLGESAVAATAAGAGPGAMAAAYLIDRNAVDGFRARAERAAAQIPSVSLTAVTGPWAPYSFASGVLPPPARAGAASGAGGRHA